MRIVWHCSGPRQIATKTRNVIECFAETLSCMFLMLDDSCKKLEPQDEDR